MEQLTCVGPGRLEWRTVDPPRLEGAHDALIAPVAVARCEIDPLLVGLGPQPDDFAVGHEAIAEVVAVGDDVRQVSVGDLVVPSFQLCCGVCAPCADGRTASCAAYPVLSDYGMASLSGTEYGGMISDLVRVPHADAMLFRLPDGLDPGTVASAADNIADGYRVVAPHLARRPGSAVLIVCHGNRSIALYALQAALALGAGEVVFSCDDASTLDVAAALGARVVPLDFGRRIGRWPIVVDCGSDPRGIHHAIESTAADGLVQSVSYYAEPTVGVPLGKMYTLGAELHIGRVHSAATVPAVLDLLQGDRLRPGAVPVTTVAWEQAPTRFLDPATKLVVVR